METDLRRSGPRVRTEVDGAVGSALDAGISDLVTGEVGGWGVACGGG